MQTNAIDSWPNFQTVLFSQVIDMNNQENYYSNETQSNFRCWRARNPNWDDVSKTGGYSPRNEAYKFMNDFVDLWMDVIGTSVYRKYLIPKTIYSAYLLGILPR